MNTTTAPVLLDRIVTSCGQTACDGCETIGTARFVITDTGKDMRAYVYDDKGVLLADGHWGGGWDADDLAEFVESTVDGVGCSLTGEELQLGCGWTYPDQNDDEDNWQAFRALVASHRSMPVTESALVGADAF